MKELSDDQEGFIPSEVEIKPHQSTKLNNTREATVETACRSQVKYRFADGFLKKEPPLSYLTPDVLRQDPHPLRVQLPSPNRNSWEHPYREYCTGNQWTLEYCRPASDPVLYEKEFLRNELALRNLEDRGSAALKQLKPWEWEEEPSGQNLQFDSRFESGNLHCVFRKRGSHEYHLFMSNDTNTLGYNQWFYFAVRGAKKQITYSFRIVNYRKQLDFYRHGQRITMFSMKEAQNGREGWRRTGFNIQIQESYIRSVPDRKFYTLKFELHVPHQNDCILLSSTLPYSYSRLQADLSQICQQSTLSLAQISLSDAGLSLCGNPIPEVTISSKNDPKDKRFIVVMARQHPGQTGSSYAALGLMKGLLVDTPQNRWLLDNVTLKIYPMVNVDGVIYGNFRCDASGVDLNRRWREPSKIFHPQIYEIKKRIANLNKRGRVDVCFDLHGHSKKYNAFTYACRHNSYTCRLLPYLISQATPIFHLPSSTFGLSRDKESTARAAISRIMRSENVLTIEASACGTRIKGEVKSFDPKDLYELGSSLIRACRHFLDKKSQAYIQSQQIVRENYNQYLAFDQQNQQESGSDSEPELDEIDFKVKITTIFDIKHEHQQRSFIREEPSVVVHRNEIVFHQKVTHQEQNQQNKVQKQEKQEKKEKSAREPPKLHKIRPPARAEGLQQKPEIVQRKHLSVYRQVAGPIELSAATQRHSEQKVAVRNIVIREKKRSSVGQELKDSKQLKKKFSRDHHEDKQVKQVKQYVTLPVGEDGIKWKQLRQEEDNKKIGDFISRFERYIPPGVGRGRRLQALQEGLEHDDPQLQLNAMLENKRKLELEKIKRSIEDSTDIAERQGKIKFVRKEPIIDFRRFKQNQRARNQARKLGELSERYLEGQY